MDEKFKQQILDILLSCVGKSNQKKSGDIAKSIGMPDEPTHARIRKCIHKTAEENNLSLVSDNKGFYLADNKKDINKYKKNIDNRSEKMLNRKSQMVNNFKEKNK